MRNLRTALVATAMALGLGLAAAPASAHFMGGGGGHFGGGHFGHWSHWGHGGGFGYGVVDVGGYDDGCIRWRPTYDNAGNYMGREPVSVCD
jgi:hypothetical protein